MSKMTSGQRQLSTSGQQNYQQNANVGPTNDCYLGSSRRNPTIDGHSGSGEEVENVKSVHTDRQTERQTTDDRWSEKLT